MEILLTFLIIAACFAGLGIGLILTGKKLKGSCGGVASKGKGPDIECSICGKKGDEIDSCEESDAPKKKHSSDSRSK